MVKKDKNVKILFWNNSNDLNFRPIFQNLVLKYLGEYHLLKKNYSKLFLNIQGPKIEDKIDKNG